MAQEQQTQPGQKLTDVGKAERDKRDNVLIKQGKENELSDT